MNDSTALLVTEIVAQGRTLDAIRYLRRTGLTFATARKYVLEISNGETWWGRAANRARRNR